MKKTIACILCIILLISAVFPSTMAVNRDVSFENDLALDLKMLGLFKGVSDTNFDLKRAPTRIEALIMLIRTLGKEQEALNGNWKHPFVDVESWADRYIGYAYEQGLTTGVSSNKFGSGSADSAMYLTFVLRALGYSDKNGDFSWNNPYSLAYKVGIIPEEVNIDTFWRADVVLISYSALSAKIKGTDQKLSDKLISSNVFTREIFDTYFDINKLNKTNTNVPSSSQNTTSLTAQQIASKCSPAVFYAEIYGFNGELRGSGSGFFISSDGYAITNFHVAANAGVINIITSDGKKYTNVDIVDGDEHNDLALLKVQGSGFPYLHLGDSSKIEQGQQVYAIGSPHGLDNTLSQGIISNPSRTIDDIEYIQISVPIDHGSSGGALIDTSGKVIGITSAGYENSQADINFAIPIDKINLLDKTPNKSIVLLQESYYPGFSSVYDFGNFTGVELIDYVALPLGAIYVYDAFDFHDIGSIEASDCYAITMYYYYTTLLQNGLTRTEAVDSFFGLFESEEESVYFEVDLEKSRSIYIKAELKPHFYSKYPYLLDFGWYSNLNALEFTFDDGCYMYSYNWSKMYNYDSFSNVVMNYLEYLLDSGYTLVDSKDDAFLFEGNGLSIVFSIDESFFDIDIAKLK